MTQWHANDCAYSVSEGAMSKPIICLDFDGVIHSYTSGWQGPRNIPDEPVEGAFDFMLDAMADGYKIVVHSSRARYFGGIRAMRSWMYRHAGIHQWYESGAGPGFPFMGLESVRFVRWKPPAVVTIDDRAIRFTGTFPTPKDAVALQPWNKARNMSTLLNDAMMMEHRSHIEFENQLYATLVDPVGEGSIKEAEMRKRLLESARWYRQHVEDLENQLNEMRSKP
jgi:hypothetical protein